ncbi:6441_t:CDS:1 [Paraglomus occultum]|uniref:6441_t:CDS:1 n=1 Tax=Paraglomus occultum TaxID=144539 RepID=A0A9N9GV47_9GLOM|nr:6441_t:CDS:1 [Paraglomus occultum]
MSYSSAKANQPTSSFPVQSSSTSSTVPTVPPEYFKTFPNGNKPLVNPDGSFMIFNWKNTRSTLTDKPFVGRIPPPTNSPNSLFIDRKFNRIADRHILDYFRNDLIGVDFKPQHQFLQLTFKDKPTFEHHLNSSPVKIQDKLIHLTPPKNFPRSSLVIHLHGLPIMDRKTITDHIQSALSPFCKIKEIAPVVLADTNLLTNKWDAVVQPNPSTKIPVQLMILNSSVALTWPDSSKICLNCHSLEHTHRICPHRQPPKPKPSRTYAQIVSTPTTTNKQQHISNHAPSQTDSSPSNTTYALDKQNSLHTSIHSPKPQIHESNALLSSNDNSSGFQLQIIDETDTVINEFADFNSETSSNMELDTITNTNSSSPNDSYLQSNSNSTAASKINSFSS